MQLRYDPVLVFRTSTTPAGLYARQKWLRESQTKNWKTDFQNTVSDLLKGQLPDGSWANSIIETVRRLFGLHLTIRNRIEATTKALEWLSNEVLKVFPRKRLNMGEAIHNQTFKGQPFTKGCSGIFLYGSTLFLSSIFGLEKKLAILRTYEWFESQGVRNHGRWCGFSCSNNLLRAFVVHPEYAKRRAITLAVNSLSLIQNARGQWSNGVPFYKTLNALAHLDLAESDLQVERAFRILPETQNKDGTWGRNDREWNTFLTVHALKNKGEL